MHLIFFDDRCPYCHRSVRYLIEIDTTKKLQFASFRGNTAKEILTGPLAYLRKGNSLVLAELYQSTERQFYSHFHALLRAHWICGNGWGLVGIFSFLPKQLGNFFYNAFAAHRHQFTLEIPELPGPQDRFLP